MLSPIYYLITGAMALILGSALSGCRWGNHVVEPAETPTSTGNYNTLPVDGSLSFCATLTPSGATTSTSNCEPQALNYIPDEIAEYFPNPVFFEVNDPTTGDAGIGAPNSTSGLPVTWRTDNSFDTSLSGDPAELWLDAGCSLTFEILINNGKLATPRLSMDVTVIRQLSGDCTNSLTQLQQCYMGLPYSDGTSCSSDDLTTAQTLVQPYIDAGALTVVNADGTANVDFLTLQNLTYSVSYQ